MIKTVAEVGRRDGITEIALPLTRSNISTPDINNKFQNPKNPFLIGSTKFYEKASAVYEKVKYFIGEELSNDDGNFIEPYNFKVNCVGGNFVIIYFDTLNNAHPKSITAILGSGRELSYELKSSVVAIPKDWSDNVDIIIKDWNKPNSPIVITGVTTHYSIDEFISIDLEGADRSDVSHPSWGIKSNNGSFKFIDKHNIIESLSKTLLKNNAKLNGDKFIFSIKNSNKSQTIATLKFSSQVTDRKTNECTVNLTDDLQSWQNVDVKKYNTQDFYNIETKSISKTAYELFQFIQEKVPIEYGRPYLSFDEDTEKYLKLITVKFPFLEEGSLWAQITKVCELTGCYVYRNHLGEACVKYGGGT